MVTVAFGIAVALWIVVGDRLPGGRWLAVHLFTLGVLTNAIVTFSQHFGRTVTRAPRAPTHWHTAVLNGGVLLVLFGIPAHSRWSTAAGATVVTAVVFASYWRLRGMRKQAVGARFSWIARMYERAHGHFIHGAVLGLLLGVGLLPGPWYGAGRIAHLHVNVLGWAGLTLLATLVFFGPTMVRTRIEQDADARAATALRWGAGALTGAVLLLLATGVGGVAATVLRVVAAVALGAYAWSVGAVCGPVLRAAIGAKPSATRAPLVAVCCWFPLLAWADVVVIATGQLRFLDALGLAALAGVLAQAVATALVYVAPAVRGRTTPQRSLIMDRLGRGAVPRTLMYNAGVAAIAVAAAASSAMPATGAQAAAVGWLVVIGTLALQVVVGVWPVGRDERAGVA